jgi:4-hydroxy-4-methyl-2-oxoglutarate aldolase
MTKRFAGIAAGAVLLLAPALAHGQLFTITKEQLIELTSQNPFERFPDGRPKIPDSLLERAKAMSAEEVWSGLNAAPAAAPQAAPAGGRGGAAGGQAAGGRGGAGGGQGAGGGGRGGPAWRNQWEDGWQILHPKMRLVGRAFTVQFMPSRPDLDTVVNATAQKAGLGRMSNQTAIDMLQPGDVMVVDLFGKGEGGTIVGDNLFYYIMKTTKNAGLVVDGAIRDLTGIQEMMMPTYYRKAHPTAIANVTITGINIPVRIGNATVMPGDMVFGDAEGIYFVPPHLVQGIVDNSDVVRIHDEWTRKKFDEGKYKSSDIYGSPRDPALRQEYQEYLKKRLEEIRKK